MTRPGWPDLPALLAEIAEVVGIEAALSIAEAKGGQAASIPSRLRDDHWLVKAIGRERAETLSEHFCSGRSRAQLDIPLGPTGSYLGDRRRRAAVVRQRGRAPRRHHPALRPPSEGRAPAAAGRGSGQAVLTRRDARHPL